MTLLLQFAINFDLNFYDYICVHFLFHFIFSVYNLSYSVTCGEPTITITFQNQEENMEHVFVLHISCARGTGKNY
jgi:hypothetical protein